MQELHDIGVDPRAYRLFYKLNEGCKIWVWTGCGYSEWSDVGDILGQGSGGAARVSALNLSRKIDAVFSGGEDMVTYGSIVQNPYCFQDDVLIPVSSINSL